MGRVVVEIGSLGETKEQVVADLGVEHGEGFQTEMVHLARMEPGYQIVAGMGIGLLVEVDSHIAEEAVKVLNPFRLKRGAGWLEDA